MSDFAPIPKERPHFWSVEVAQEFLATRYDGITPWLCAQRARAFLFLARRYGILSVMGCNYWRSARAFVTLGRRVRLHGVFGAVHFPSDWLRSDRFLERNTVKLDATQIKEEFFAAINVSSAREALEAVETVIARGIRLRPQLLEAVRRQVERERQEGAKLPPPRGFIPSRMMRRVRKEAA